MAEYEDLGARPPAAPQQATPDQTGKNTGNWTVTFDKNALNCQVAQAEVYQIAIDGPVGSTFALYRNNRLWNNVVQGWSNNYDPVNPLYIRPGDSLFFYWDASVMTAPVPTVTLWLRYDTELRRNKYGGGG